MKKSLWVVLGGLTIAAGVIAFAIVKGSGFGVLVGTAFAYLFAPSTKKAPVILPPEKEDFGALDAEFESTRQGEADKAAADAGKVAGEDWATARTRKRPRLPGLILALGLSGFAGVAPASVDARETDKKGPASPEEVAAAMMPRPEGCAPYDPASAPASGIAPGFGLWSDSTGVFVCRCFNEPGQFGEVTMLPAGCALPKGLPLIGLRVEDWQALVSDFARVNAENQANAQELGRVRNERDSVKAREAGLLQYIGNLERENNAAHSTVNLALGGGILAGFLAGGILVYLVR